MVSSGCFKSSTTDPPWCHARVKCKISKDNAQTWSDSDVIAFKREAWPAVDHSSQRWRLSPPHHETGDDEEKTANRYAAISSATIPRQNRRSPTGFSPRPATSPGLTRPDRRQISRLLPFCPGGDFLPNPDRFLTGKRIPRRRPNPVPGESTEFGTPNSAADFIKLKTDISSVFNDTNTGDRMLSPAVSTDHDKTYPHRRNVIHKPGDTAAYPSAIQTQGWPNPHRVHPGKREIEPTTSPLTKQRSSITGNNPITGNKPQENVTEDPDGVHSPDDPGYNGTR